MADKDSLEVAGEEDRIVTGPPRPDDRPAPRPGPAADEAPPLPVDGGSAGVATRPGVDAAPDAPAAHSDHMLGAEPVAVADEPAVAELAARIAVALAEESPAAELAGETRLPTVALPMFADVEPAVLHQAPDLHEAREPETAREVENSAPASSLASDADDGNPVPHEAPASEPAEAQEPREDWLVERIGRAAERHAAAQPVARAAGPPPVTSLPEPAPPYDSHSRAPHDESAAPAPRYVPPPPFEPAPPAHDPAPPAYEAPRPAHEPAAPASPPAPSPVREIALEPIRAFRREAPADLRDVRPGADARFDASLLDRPLADAPPADTPPAPSRGARAWRLIVTAGRYALLAVGCYLAFVVFLIVLYRVVNPPISNLMLIRALGGSGITRTWVPLEQISPELVRAVIVSEDGRFCEHYGIDLGAIREAIQRSRRGIPRGASTISMQVTKNLFLWPAKSYVRKLVELPLTLVAEFVWPKWRMLEIYLNIAEWGPGIFGAEAAAQYHFNKPASQLRSREAALLAAALPNPVARAAGAPGPGTSRKAAVVQGRMYANDEAFSCVLKR